MQNVLVVFLSEITTLKIHKKPNQKKRKKDEKVASISVGVVAAVSNHDVCSRARSAGVHLCAVSSSFRRIRCRNRHTNPVCFNGEAGRNECHGVHRETFYQY